METENQREGVVYLEKFTSRKAKRAEPQLDGTADSLSAWAGRYLELAVVGVRSKTVAEKAALHLGRFVEFFEKAYGHDRISTVVRRDEDIRWPRRADPGLTWGRRGENRRVSPKTPSRWNCDSVPC